MKKILELSVNCEYHTFITSLIESAIKQFAKVL